MKLVRNLFFNLAFIGFIFLSLSCSRKDENKIFLDFWAMGFEGEQVSKLIPEFERKYPEVKVKVQQIPWVAAHEKLITAFASETMPDVFQIGNTWIPEFHALGSIEQLDPFLNNSFIKKENYFEGIWETNLLDSALYGIPWYVDTRVLFYRSDILARAGYNQPPKTWDELYDVSKKIKQLKGFEDKYAFFIPTNEWLPFVLFGMQLKSDILKNNYSYGNFSGPEYKKAYNFLMRFFYEGLAPADMQQVLNVYQAFEEGFYSMYITGPWNVTEFKNRLPDHLQDHWMTAPLPSPDSIYPGMSLAGGSSIAINNKSMNKEYAWKLIEFLSEKETQVRFYKMVSSLPAVKSAWEDSSFAVDPYMKAFYIQLDRTVPTPKIPEWEQIVYDKIQTYAQYTAVKKMTVDEAMRNLDRDVNKILEKRRWLLSTK